MLLLNVLDWQYLWGRGGRVLENFFIYNLWLAQLKVKITLSLQIKISHLSVTSLERKNNWEHNLGHYFFLRRKQSFFWFTKTNLILENILKHVFHQNGFIEIYFHVIFFMKNIHQEIIFFSKMFSEKFSGKVDELFFKFSSKKNSSLHTLNKLITHLSHPRKAIQIKWYINMVGLMMN